MIYSGVRFNSSNSPGGNQPYPGGEGVTMALAVILLAGLVIFAVTGVVVWGGYLLVGYLGRLAHHRRAFKQSPAIKP